MSMIAPERPALADLIVWLRNQQWSHFAQDLVRSFDRTGGLSERQVEAAANMMAKSERRNAERVARPANPNPVTDTGFYMAGDDIYRVKRSQAGNLYACVRRNGSWDYARGALRTLTADHKVTAEVAAQYGIRTGICLFCDAKLEDRDGLGALVGVGPVCARKHLGMTQRQLADRIGVA